MSDCDVESHIDDTIQISTLEPARAVLSEQQKYRKSFDIGQCLCQQLSTFGIHDFNEGIEVLQSIAHLWEKGKKIVVGEAVGIISVRECYLFLRVYVCIHCMYIYTHVQVFWQYLPNFRM